MINYLYHGTTKDRLASIRKHGLKIPKSSKEKNYSFSRKAVYFVNNAKKASQWPHDASYGVKGDWMAGGESLRKKGQEVVLKVKEKNVKKDLQPDRNLLSWGKPKSFEYPKNVPAKDVSRKYRQRQKNQNLGYGPRESIDMANVDKARKKYEKKMHKQFYPWITKKYLKKWKKDIKEDAPANAMGSGTNIATFSPLLFRRKLKRFKDVVKLGKNEKSSKQ